MDLLLLLPEWITFFLALVNWFGPVFLGCGLLGVIFLLVFIKSDCDLSLKAYEKLGKDPSQTLRGKVVWITGASSGIGEDLSYKLATCGAKLVLSARREKALRKVLEKCKGK